MHLLVESLASVDDYVVCQQKLKKKESFEALARLVDGTQKLLQKTKMHFFWSFKQTRSSSLNVA